jgi:hypothetical protein
MEAAMDIVRRLTAVLAIVGAVMPTVCFSETVYLKEMPKEGEIPFRKIVYVDDGKCPKGEVKEVTGGSRERAIPRQVRCVKRPDK